MNKSVVYFDGVQAIEFNTELQEYCLCSVVWESRWNHFGEYDLEPGRVLSKEEVTEIRRAAALKIIEICKIQDERSSESI